MRKKILFTSISILIFLSLFISYLSIFGIKTNNFNNLISKKIKEYDSKLTIEIDEVFIKLNLLESALSINTKNANLLAQSDQIKISNIDINLNLIKFLNKKNSIKNLKITSSDNFIKDVSSFLNNINYDLSRYIFYSQIKKGLINFEIDVEFGKDTRNISSYLITGSVNTAKFNLPSDQNINEINFNFQSRNKKNKIINLNFIYQDIIFSSKNLEIKEEKFW